MLLVLGLGYSGRAVARQAQAAGRAVARHGARPRLPGRLMRGPWPSPSPPPAEAIRAATHLLVTAPPGEAGDPVLATHGAALAAALAAGTLRWVGYVSTTGVYGDRGGAEVDEATAPAPGQPRSRRRLAAEQAWRDATAGRAALDLMRAGGIYGPGRSVFDDLRAGTARRVVKPGHAFSRIHRDDIALAALAAMAQDRAPAPRVLHLVDDEPAESADGDRIRRASARHRPRRPPSPSRTRARHHVPHGAVLLVGEPPRRQCRDQGGARHRLALSDLPRGPSRHSRRRSGARVSPSSARSCGRDSRWSPSLTRWMRTSSPVNASAMRSACRQGTSGSRWPCRMRTGTSIGSGARSSRWRRPSSISARVMG